LRGTRFAVSNRNAYSSNPSGAFLDWQRARGNWHVSIAIVDSAGAFLKCERLDGASPLTAEVAQGKARASALLQIPTRVAEGLLKEHPGALKLVGPIDPMRGSSDV